MLILIFLPDLALLTAAFTVIVEFFPMFVALWHLFPLIPAIVVLDVSHINNIDIKLMLTLTVTRGNFTLQDE